MVGGRELSVCIVFLRSPASGLQPYSLSALSAHTIKKHEPREVAFFQGQSPTARVALIVTMPALYVCIVADPVAQKQEGILGIRRGNRFFATFPTSVIAPS
jgi:hypothetical protein